MANFTRRTTEDLINNGKYNNLSGPSDPDGATVITTLGYSSRGDGGGAEWVFTGVTGQTPSQSPAQLGDALINDVSGNQWELIPCEKVNSISVGVSEDSIDNAPAMNAAISFAYRKHSGGVFTPAGTYIFEAEVKPLSGVSLVGDFVNLQIESAFDPIHEGYPNNATIFKSGASLSTSLIHFDFTLPDRDSRPYSTLLQYLFLDGENQSAGDGIYTTPPPPGEGVFNNGAAGRAIKTSGVVITRFPRNGIRNVNPSDERVTIDMDFTRVGFSGEDNVYMENAFDSHVTNSAFFAALDGSNFYHTKCAGIRFLLCDFFLANRGVRDYSGDGITDDSYACIYDECYIDNNYGNGINFISINEARNNRYARVLNSLISANGGDYLDSGLPYYNIKINQALGGDSINGLSFVGTTFGNGRFKSTDLETITNQVYQESESIDFEGGNRFTGCTLNKSDLLDSLAPMNNVAWQEFTFSNTNNSSGNPLNQKQKTLPDYGGANFNVPGLSGSASFITSNTSAATLTRVFGDANDASLEGKEITVQFGDANTTINFANGNFIGNAGLSKLMPINSVALFRKMPGQDKWYVLMSE